jgi:hypothetical protein
MIKSIWWVLGYPDEELEQADHRQKNLKHLVCKQIRDSKLVLKKYQPSDKTIKWMNPVAIERSVKHMKRRKKQ